MKIDWFLVIVDTIFYAICTAILIEVGREMGWYGFIIVLVISIGVFMNGIEKQRFPRA